ncbi:MAG: hypothetical protein KY459_07845 [Acidobacteria bacterium]|nr:hypothetical protein [Acidobacteriota bacterium]
MAEEPEENSIDRIIALYKRDVDLSLLREYLKKTPTERLLALQELQRFAEELRRAGEAARDKK